MAFVDHQNGILYLGQVRLVKPPVEKIGIRHQNDVRVARHVLRKIVRTSIVSAQSLFQILLIPLKILQLGQQHCIIDSVLPEILALFAHTQFGASFD